MATAFQWCFVQHRNVWCILAPGRDARQAEIIENSTFNAINSFHRPPIKPRRPDRTEYEFLYAPLNIGSHRAMLLSYNGACEGRSWPPEIILISSANLFSLSFIRRNRRIIGRDDDPVGKHCIVCNWTIKEKSAVGSNGACTHFTLSGYIVCVIILHIGPCLSTRICRHTPPEYLQCIRYATVIHRRNIYSAHDFMSA